MEMSTHHITESGHHMFKTMMNRVVGSILKAYALDE